MTTYLIEPQVPLVFRSGRPFGAGGRDGANFPWPSALAGLLRTQYMDDRGWQAPLNENQVEQLRALATAGPLLARRRGGSLTPLCPKPADALYLQDDQGATRVYRLRPGDYPAGCDSDLPAGLRPLMATGAPESKPQPGPAWWPLQTLLAWRRGDEVDFASLAMDEPGREDRTHVALDPDTFAARPGDLFQTQGLDYGRCRNENRRGYEESDWVFLGRFAEEIQARMVTFGGERRLSWLEPLAGDPLALPLEHRAALEAVGAGLPAITRPEIAGKPAPTDACRAITLTLATPALFREGWKPAWLEEGKDVPGIKGLRLKLVAAAVERWQGISGWDLAWINSRGGRGGAKPARKAVAAGATYWFEIIGEPPENWAEQLWLAPLSDAEQDRRDGFGLAVPGIQPNPFQ
ncbi:MAG: type III-B CRISPR module-associated Cmr3 family protein [Pseudomonadota bacterium]|nr:type III-B CRISPR module-associated Cmr3 family protein [Pseudomonadota bacterium]